MLWLNTAKGDVIEAPKRPSPAWVSVVGINIVKQDVESTLEGLRRAMMKSDSYALRPNDFEWVEKTGLNVYAHEVWWKKTITDADFPYLKMIIASDGTLEIRYDENAKDDTSKDTISTKEISEDDSPLKRGGQRGTGKSGKGGPPMPGGENGEPIDEPPEEPDEIIDDDFDPDGDSSQDDEERDAYKEGQESADSISDEVKEKMKEKMDGKGKPADESGPSSGPAPDGSEGGAPAEDPTGEAGEGTGDGQGTPTEGEGGGEGDADDGEGEGGEGEGEDGSGGDGEPCDTCGKQGEECSCDSPSEDAEPEPTDDPQDASGDGGDSEDTNLPPEEKDALDQCVEEAEDGKDAAEEAMQSADGDEAKKAAQEARDAAKEAWEIVLDNVPEESPEDHEKVQEAEQYADDAEDFADLAEELEEEIRELFDESGLDEEDYEEFKEGLLDELFGEDSEFSDELTEREKRLREKIERRERNKKSRGLIRCVNWETGKIKSFPETEIIGDTWIQITKFFSPFETANGKQIVVDRTIEGAIEMANALGIKAKKRIHLKKPFAQFQTNDEAFIDALKKMRMFTVKGGGSKPIVIRY